jgi:aspartyl-tRNA(Asn)/glutamyl-tRNA(Gln) amidotransferase subunit B
VRKPGGPLGTRCEIKNVNSIRFIGQAIEHEARRQIGLIEDGGVIEQETRLFDPDRGETRSMRSKEEAHDYRYFPDPDLLPLELSPSFVEDLRKNLPESEEATIARYLGYDLTRDDVDALLADREMRQEFEASRNLTPNVSPKAVLNWLRNDHLARLRREGLTFETSPISRAANTAIIELTSEKRITNADAKVLYDRVWTASSAAPTIHYIGRGEVQRLADELLLEKAKVGSAGDVEKIVDDIVAKNPDKVADAKTNPKAIGWFVGQVMKASSGKANPQTVNELLKKRIGV